MPEEVYSAPDEAFFVGPDPHAGHLASRLEDGIGRDAAHLNAEMAALHRDEVPMKVDLLSRVVLQKHGVRLQNERAVEDRVQCLLVPCAVDRLPELFFLLACGFLVCGLSRCLFGRSEQGKREQDEHFGFHGIRN